MATSLVSSKAIASVYPMIYKKSKATFNQTAKHTRNWMALEDHIADNVLLTISKAKKKFKKDKGSKFSTYLFKALDNNNINRVTYLTAQERDEHKTVSYDSDTVSHKGSTYAIDYFIARTQRVASPEDSVILKVDTERAFLATYLMASNLLRKYLIRWLLQPKTTKFKDGIAFRVARGEFRGVSTACGLSYNLCQHLTDNEHLRLEMCFKIVFILRVRTPRHENRPVIDLHDCEERELVPLAVKFI